MIPPPLPGLPVQTQYSPSSNTTASIHETARWDRQISVPTGMGGLFGHNR